MLIIILYRQRVTHVYVESINAMQANKVCNVCNTLGHSGFYCKDRKFKTITKQSYKEQIYQEWKEGVARLKIIKRDGNLCQCCGRQANNEEKLDIDHIISKGSRPDLKTDLNNLQLLCRAPCHFKKTNNILCLH